MPPMMPKVSLSDSCSMLGHSDLHTWPGPDEHGTDLFSTPQDLDSLRHQLEQLVEENVELELELQRSQERPPGSPGEGESGLG